MLCAVYAPEAFPPIFAVVTASPTPEAPPLPSLENDDPLTRLPQNDSDPEAIRWRPEAFLSFAYGDEGEVLAAHVGAAYEFDPVNRVEVVPQLGVGVAQNTDDDRPAITFFDLQMRWTAWEYEGWEAFLEWGAGLQYVGPESFPRSGTHANGRLRAGAGVRYFLEDRADLIAGVGWLHMSNANVLDVNVGHDGPMFYLGFTWRY
ncbi:MAG: acyloxyacyl hydrolase [Planctomycetota bacterium]